MSWYRYPPSWVLPWRSHAVSNGGFAQSPIGQTQFRLWRNRGLQIENWKSAPCEPTAPKARRPRSGQGQARRASPVQASRRGERRGTRLPRVWGAEGVSPEFSIQPRQSRRDRLCQWQSRLSPPRFSRSQELPGAISGCRGKSCSAKKRKVSAFAGALSVNSTRNARRAWLTNDRQYLQNGCDTHVYNDIHLCRIHDIHMYRMIYICIYVSRVYHVTSLCLPHVSPMCHM